MILRQKIEEIDLLKEKVKDLETALEGIKRQNKILLNQQMILTMVKSVGKRKTRHPNVKFVIKYFQKIMN